MKIRNQNTQKNFTEGSTTKLSSELELATNHTIHSFLSSNWKKKSSLFLLLCIKPQFNSTKLISEITFTQITNQSPRSSYQIKKKKKLVEILVKNPRISSIRNKFTQKKGRSFDPNGITKQNLNTVLKFDPFTTNHHHRAATHHRSEKIIKSSSRK